MRKIFQSKIYLLICFFALLILNSCNEQDVETEMDDKAYSRISELSIPAPKAKRELNQLTYHGRELEDHYFWLKDQSYPVIDDTEVLDYLNAENRYFEHFIDSNSELVDTLFEEFKGRVEEEEKSLPYIKNGYEYWWYYKKDSDYPTYVRRKIGSQEVQIVLDEAKLAADYDYFVIGDWKISPDNTLLAYTQDTSGDERYVLKVFDLDSMQYKEDVLTDVQGDILFGANSDEIIYSLLEKDRWHAKEVKVHKIGDSQSEDKTIYSEEDDGFFINFYLTSDEEYLIISSSRSEVTEIYLVPRSNLSSKLLKVVSREQGFDSTIDHSDDRFYILANDSHKNFRFASVSDLDPDYEKWETILDGSDSRYFLGLQTFEDFIVLKCRDNGLDKILVGNYSESFESVEFPESPASVALGYNPEYQQSFVRLSFQSMITPRTTFDYQVQDKNLITKKVQVIPSGYEKTRYKTERIMIKARDGKDIPVSLVYKSDFVKDGNSPMMLYGYGAYGSTISPTFSTLRLSLLDRGFAYAIAHIRGGSMLGYQWYLDGKLEKRENTFNDFVDVGMALIKLGYSSKNNISISGRSAGGELMGAAVIQSPELWRSVILGVPFVDVLNTMLDESLPLTPPEWEEWGNPIKSPEAFDLIKGYSPYDNIKSEDYPPMLVTGGLNDPRVTYWEPAKWTAKMRHLKTDDNLLLMRMNMGSGHFANSGRFGRLKDYAQEYSFVLRSHGIER